MNYRKLQAVHISAIITDETDDYLAEYRVSGTIAPFVPARIGCDPDDGWAAEGGEIEITSVELVKFEADKSAIAEGFEKRLETDKKLLHHIHERLAEAAAEQDDGPDSDRYRD